MPTTTDQLYTEYDFTLTPPQPWSDVLMAQLGSMGFESFIETEVGFKGYIPRQLENRSAIEGLDLMDHDLVHIAFAKAELPATNWNQEWEQNFKKITVAGRCVVRAPFHNQEDTEYDIVITPKMSFGTGHHQTTYMMLEMLLQEAVAGKSVLDMGCGTGVLAILAAKRNAALVHAIDYDEWCYRNALENVATNKVQVQVELGASDLLIGRSYDLILANINRNVLLKDIPLYADCLTKMGVLLLSGFYACDLDLVLQVCKESGLVYDLHQETDEWVALKVTNKIQ